jgi:hypothetical protein
MVWGCGERLEHAAAVVVQQTDVCSGNVFSFKDRFVKSAHTLALSSSPGVANKIRKIDDLRGFVLCGAWQGLRLGQLRNERSGGEATCPARVSSSEHICFCGPCETACV